LRRARGYAPAPIILPSGFEKVAPILAMGSELKNTFCLLREGEAILSQHLGDLENAAGFNAYQETLNLYLNLFAHKPEIIAIDKHPEYLSSKLGKELATSNEIKLIEIQQHHAHIAACMAENKIPLDAKPILGIAFDGLGYGEDGTLWGGEFLLADYQKFQRIATFKPVAMIGGEQA
ncbi:MAG: carbamoyltransferase HypF, partial [Sphaerospermopsis kisseleviana]